ncbi:DNA polymerase III subunit chi [Arenimonas sp. MALMAid1274]|uniref:DNA polymerase III subunit chi n=1 Tax=Arenimonas sp. MALMAid1274 TaxID=3411630 RepID=UPI003BA0F6DE
MPSATFYLIGKPRFREQPLLLACELARKASDAGLPMLVLCASAEQAELLDDLLWSFDPDAYVPHQIVGADEDEDEVPVLLAAPEHDVPLRPLVLNLRDAAVPDGFERVLEVVPADDSARGPLRERWKAYAARGLEVQKHDM